MDIQNKRILVLGGYGLAGQAVIRRLMREKPAHIVITSIHQHEAESAVEMFEKTYSKEDTTWEAFWGNLFVREDWKDDSREEILKDPVRREQLIEDILGDLTEEVVTNSALHGVIE